MLDEAPLSTIVAGVQDDCREVRKNKSNILKLKPNLIGFVLVSQLGRYLQVEFARAIEDFDEAIRLDSSVANFFYNRGLIMFRLKVPSGGRDTDKCFFGFGRVTCHKMLELEQVPHLFLWLLLSRPCSDTTWFVVRLYVSFFFVRNLTLPGVIWKRLWNSILITTRPSYVCKRWNL